MHIAYFDCFSGISGDMLLGALVDAGVPLDACETNFPSCPWAAIHWTCRKVTRREMSGTQVLVLDHSPGQGQSQAHNGNGHAAYPNGHEQDYSKRTATDLTQIITRSLLSDDVKQKAAKRDRPAG